MADKNLLPEEDLRRVLRENIISWEEIKEMYYIPDRRTFASISKAQGISPVFARANFYLRQEIERMGFVRRTESGSDKEE